MARHILWLLALLLPATTTAQSATTDTVRWRHVGRAGKAVLEFDTRSIVPVENERNQYEVWVRLTYDSPQRDRPDSKAPYDQLLDRSMFDCPQRQMKMGGQIMFYHRDSVVASIGNRLRTEILSWQAWPPGSIGESAGEAICAYVSGRGPGTGGGRLLAPSLEVSVIPPPAPSSVRGKTVIIRLHVDTSGVVRDAELIPPTGDRKFDGELKRLALRWRFRPARDANNQPVATKFEVTFTF